MDTEAKNRYQQVVQKTLDEFAQAIARTDFFECAKKIGVMEYIGLPDIDYYTALAFHVNKDTQKAISLYEKIGKSSNCYGMALQDLAIDYMLTGDYLKLQGILEQEEYSCTPLEELDIRIKCLEHMHSDVFAANKAALDTIEARDVTPAKYSGDEAERFFMICSMLADALVIAGECINQCSNYQFRTGTVVEDVPNNPDLARFANEYEKWCYILQLSKHLLVFKLPDGLSSLADCALIKLPWDKKVDTLISTNYAQQVMQIILTLCRPEVHPSIKPIRAIGELLEAFIHINPKEIAHVISHYYTYISEAYIEDGSGIAQYIGYAYSEILATGQDPFNLESRIKTLRDDKEYGTDLETASQIKMVRQMSRKAYDALMNAESTFAKTHKDIPGARDYSALSLQFFRVLEIEYSEKLLCPLANAVDIDQFKELIEQTEDDRNYNAWKRDGNYLEKIKNGGQTSIEVGAVRTLLGHVIGYYTKDDPCAQYLRPIIDTLLTEDGKQALQNRAMLDVIGANILERYRTPGAHTGYMPFSAACEAIEYVQEKLPDVVSWFL